MDAHARVIPYFAYGTLQTGFANHERFADVLGERVARATTVEAFAVVVPKRASCSNPGCPLLHRMAALVPGVESVRVEGDVFMLESDGLLALDRLEGCADGNTGPYVRSMIEVVSLDGTTRWNAAAYPVRAPDGWRALLDSGAADALSAYSPELAAGTGLKPCCVRDPEHAGPHDIVDPLDLN